MKVLFSVSIFISLLCSASMSQVVIQEDFSNPSFPPTLWSTSSTGTGEPWIWTDSGQPGNGYAHGQVSMPSYGSQGETSLMTSEFFAPRWSTIHVVFDRRNSWIGATPSDYIFTMYVCHDDYETCGQVYGPTSVWTHVDYYSQTLQFSGYRWYIKWKINSQSFINPSTTYYDIDNVLIERCCVGVEPTSLGNIKAAFH